MIRSARITRRRAVLAVAVAAVAASVVYFGGRALGLGGEAPALSRGDVAVSEQDDGPATLDSSTTEGDSGAGGGDAPAVAEQGGGPVAGSGPAADGDPPVLTISVPEMCVTGQADDAYGVQVSFDEDGNQVEEGFGPFYLLEDLGMVPLTWTISGGTAPFEVSVQGQSLLTNGVEPGTTDIYCAQELSDMEPLDPDWPRELANPSTVNPGPWTISATVTDANGLSSSATTESYIVVDCWTHCDFDVFPPGFTYLINGHLITIPPGLRISAVEIGLRSSSCAPGGGPACEDIFELDVLSAGGGVIMITESGTYVGYAWRHGYVYAEGIGEDGTQAAGQAVEEHPHAARIQQLGDSIGVEPGLAAEEGMKAADVLGSE